MPYDQKTIDSARKLQSDRERLKAFFEMDKADKVNSHTAEQKAKQGAAIGSKAATALLSGLNNALKTPSLPGTLPTFGRGGLITGETIRMPSSFIRSPEKDKNILYPNLSAKPLSDIAKGAVPSLSYIDPLQSKLTHISIEPDFKKEKVRYDKFIDRRPVTEAKALQYFEETGKNLDKTVVRFDKPHGIYNKPGELYKTHLNTQYGLGDIKYPWQYENLKKLNHNDKLSGAYEFFKNSDDVAKVAKNGGKALAVVGVALDAYELGSTVYEDLNDEDKKLGKKTVSSAVGIGSSWAAGVGGAKLGAMGGAAIGTFICPGIGTAIGGFLGGVIGGIAGAYSGRALGTYIVDQTYEGD